MSLNEILTPLPYHILYEFLHKVSLLSHNVYTFDINSFKRAKYNGWIVDFINLIEPYYIKKMYITREIDFNRMVTILRQICKVNDIQFQTIMKYSHSKYFISLNIRVKT